MTTFLLTNFGHGRLLEPIDSDDMLLTVSETDALKLPEPGVGEAFAISLWDGTGDPEIVYCTSNPGTGLLVVSRHEEGTTERAWLAGTELRHNLTAETSGNILQEGFITGNMASQAEAEAGATNAKLMSPQRTLEFFNARTTAFTRDWLTADDVIAARAKLGWEVALFSGTGLEDTFVLPDDDWATPYTQVYIDEVFIESSEYAIVGDEITFDTPPDAGDDNILVVKGINFAFSIATPGANTVSTASIQDDAVTHPKMADNSVGTAEIIANNVTYAKIQQVSATDKVLGRSSAGAGNIEEIPFKATARSIGNADNVAAVQTLLTSAGWPHYTGQIAFFLAAAAPTGWIDLAGGTIGSASSGATTRANADTANLYSNIWNATTTTECPIYTSAGVLTVKGASASADFAANKRLAVPDVRGDFLRALDLGRGIDTGRVAASAQGDLVKSHLHTATFTGDAVPNHSHNIDLFDGVGAGSRVLRGTGSHTNNQSTDSAGGHTPSGTVTVDATGGAENRPRNMAFRVCVKL